MNMKIIISILTLILISAVVLAQVEQQQTMTQQQQYEAIKQQLLPLMTEEQKEEFLALTPEQQVQFIDRQIALANLRWQSEVLVDCGGVCVEGLPAIWQVRLSNLGQNNFELQTITFLDDYGNIFAQRPVNLTIPPNQIGTINVQGIIPPPSRSSTLFYKVVFVIDGNVQSEQADRRMSVMPLAEVECSDNSTCRKDEFCLGFKCRPLTALPENKTGPAPNILREGSIFYPIVTIVLLFVILIILLQRIPKRK